MQNITNYETKEIECDRCGWVGTVAKHIPLKLAWCGGCRSSRIRLHKRLLTQRTPDLAKRARPNDCEIDPETLPGRYADDPPSG